MPRTSRAKSTTGIYHIMMRGINRQNIFRDDSDKDRLLKIIHNLQSRSMSISGKSEMEYEIYAYALMDNHFHILVKVVSGELSDFVKSMASAYVLYFNKKYGCDGHLFKERFRSEPCENDDYLVTLLRYIHQNPIKAGLVNDLRQYKYTSWLEYADPVNAPVRICDTEYVLDKIPLEKLTQIVNDNLPDDTRCIDTDNPTGKMMDFTVINCLINELGPNALEEIRAMGRKERAPIIKRLLNSGAGICQLERILGVSKAAISRINNKSGTK